MSVRLRRARPDEAERLRAIEESAGARFRGSPHAYVIDFAPPPAEFYAELAAQGLVLTAEQDGEAVGFAACQVFADALHLKELSVAYEQQGRGVGRALIKAVVAKARRLGLKAVTLTTFHDLAWNGPWYARQGFVELGAGELGERLRQELADEDEHGLTARCAMRLLI